MDPRFSAQDVLPCDLCDTPVPPMYCDLCHVSLCKACVGEHLSNFSKEHKVVPFKRRGASPKYPRCQTHVEKLCELHCKECDLPVCLFCLLSNFHKGHTLLNLLEVNKYKHEAIEKDIDELLNSICPKYEEISAEIQRDKTGLEKHYENLITAVINHGEDWHREINIIVNKQKSEIFEMKSKHLAVLNKQENDIARIIAEMKQYILDLKRIRDSNDVSLTSVYKSRNVELRRLPPKLSLPSFTPHQINIEQLNQTFGFLSALSVTTEYHNYIMKTAEAVSCPQVKSLLDEPELITTINTRNKYLRSVTCLSDEEIWTCGGGKIMRLYNLQNKLLKSIQTKSGNIPNDIEVTRNEELIYADSNTRTVNIVKNDQIQEVIRLQGWKPYSVCSSFSGDLLVAMYSNVIEQSKLVRYSGSTEKQTIQFNSNDKPLYSYGNDKIKYISENRNLDICVADSYAVIVVNQAGKLRFRYTGKISTTWKTFSPHGITTDSQSQILTADSNKCIHILDQDGQFLRYIDHVDYCDLGYICSLCVDNKDNLFLVESNGKVKKIKYMYTVC